MKQNSWMAVSGAMGFMFFLIANFTSFFTGANTIAGIIQIIINTFVFVIWTKGFLESTGLKKFVASFGVIIPLVLASITIYRVIGPWVLALFA